jgi:ribosome assembly protein RRB1
MSFKASDCDINVLSWNTSSKFLLASGDDKGEFQIWDLRNLKPTTGKGEDFESITRIRWHTQAITSIQFEPREDSVLAVTSADDKFTLWDFSVEVDEQDEQPDLDMEIPPQLMFLHQGQKNMKELRFHPQFGTLIVTTAEDSFNLFRPNLEPDEEPEEAHPSDPDEETKQDSSTMSS